MGLFDLTLDGKLKRGTYNTPIVYGEEATFLRGNRGGNMVIDKDNFEIIDKKHVVFINKKVYPKGFCLRMFYPVYGEEKNCSYGIREEIDCIHKCIKEKKPLILEEHTYKEKYELDPEGWPNYDKNGTYRKKFRLTGYSIISSRVKEVKSLHKLFDERHNFIPEQNFFKLIENHEELDEYLSTDISLNGFCKKKIYKTFMNFGFCKNEVDELIEYIGYSLDKYVKAKKIYQETKSEIDTLCAIID